MYYALLLWRHLGGWEAAGFKPILYTCAVKESVQIEATYTSAPVAYFIKEVKPYFVKSLKLNYSLTKLVLNLLIK